MTNPQSTDSSVEPQLESKNSMTVFVLDDDPDMRESLGYLLESESYSFELFGSPTEFLKTYDNRPGCLLLDLQLPEMSGLEMYAELRQRGVYLPFIMISANGNVPVVVDSMRLGAIDFLEKPFRSEELLERVRKALAIAEKQQDVITKLASLTAREREFLEEIKRGHSVKQIATTLEISPKTGHIHRRNIHQKMQVGSDASLLNLLRTIQNF